MIRSRSEIFMERLIGFLMIILSFVMIYPFWYVLVASLSDSQSVINGNVLFIPRNLNIMAYEKVFTLEGFWLAYGNTVYYTLFGTIISLFVTAMGAYALSRKRLMARRFIGFMISLTMWFNAGMIPFYLNMKNFNLLNSRLGILIGFACSAFYVIILRSFFETIPDSLEESAKIDGASDFLIFRKVIVPLSMPALTTIGLYYAVERWNGYFWAMVLLTDIRKIPLQVLLKKLIVEMEMMTGGDFVTSTVMSKETVIYATIIVAAVPILIVYPFIQKYFEKGVMIGAVKG